MRHPLVLIISLVFFTLSVSAQEHVIFTYAQPIDEKRNEDIAGAYCFFEDWSPAKLYDGTNKNYSELAVNYNGHNKTMEATNGDGKYIVLRPEQAPRIVVQSEGVKIPDSFNFLDSLVFVRAPVPELKSDYYLVLFENENLRLLVEYNASVSTTVQRPPGKIIETNRFVNKYQLILVDGGKATLLGKKKRKLESAFKDYGSLSKWAKNNNLKMTDYETIVQFLESL